MGAGMWVESATDVSRAGRVGASLGAVVLGLGLAACGDDGSDGSGGPRTTRRPARRTVRRWTTPSLKARNFPPVGR